MNNGKEKLLIFDCDGVLIDSEPMANRLFLQCLRNEGFDVDEIYGEYFHGIALADCIRKVEGDFKKPLSKGFVNKFEALLDAEMQQNLVPMPGIHEALAQLPNKKCVASGSTHPRLQLALSVTGLLPQFERIFSATDVTSGKPAPDLFLHAAAQMQYAAKNCIVIEDSHPGMQAAIAANMPVLLYNPHWTDKYEVPSHVTIFNHMEDLPQLVKALSQKEQETFSGS